MSVAVPVGTSEHGYAHARDASSACALEVSRVKTHPVVSNQKTANDKREILVVAGLLWRGSKLLIQQRPPDKALPLLWEFPGGKVEPEESCEAALVRECAEELGVGVEVSHLAWEACHEAAAQRVHLRFYHARLLDDAAAIHATSAVQWAWLAPSDMLALPFCPADIALVQALARGSIVSDTR